MNHTCATPVRALACLISLFPPFLEQRRKVTLGKDVGQYDSDQFKPQSPLAALALSQVAQCHPIMASELIARACVGLIEAGNAHFARIHASMSVLCWVGLNAHAVGIFCLSS